jgi:hypothetical protein
MRYLKLPLAALLVLGLSASPAHAQSDADRATARALGQEGQQALDGKNYATAEDRFRRADKILHAPTLMLGLARSLAGGGKFVEAQETYNRIVREGVPPGAPEVFKRAVDEATKEVDAVASKVGSVTITVKAAAGGDVGDPQAVLDEHPINSASLGVRRAVDPGDHVLRVSSTGFKTAEVRFSVTAGGSVDEPVTLEKDLTATPVAAPPPGPGGAAAGFETVPAVPPTKGHSVLPWVAFGVGGAGLVVGVVTGIIAMGKHSTLGNECPGGTCSSAGALSDLDSYHSIGTISTIGFVVAGVGGAAGVVLLLTQPKGAGSAQPAARGPGLHVVPVIGAGSIGAAGTF